MSMTVKERDLVLHYAPMWEAAKILFNAGIINRTRHEIIVNEIDRQFAHDYEIKTGKEFRK